VTAGNGKWAPVAGKIPGVAVNLGGHLLVLAPLGIGKAREFSERGKALEPSDTDGMQALGIAMVHASLARNYPEITLDEVEALLDVGNLQEATQAIAAQSGLKKVTPGELTPGSQ
jgi:hypothetical protein